MATISKEGKRQQVPNETKSSMLQSVYVVVGESYDQMEDNAKDVINIRHGILRIFANKDDVKAYMQKYFDENFSGDDTINITESKDGFYKAEIRCERKNEMKGAVSFEGSLEGRVYKLRVEAYKKYISSFSDDMIGDEDLYETLYE